MDAMPPAPPESPAQAQDPPAYTYAVTDIRPRQPREIELCEKASHFDWLYTGSFVLGFVAANYVNLGYLKHTQEPGYRLTGVGLVGFTWGGILGGGYLSLPKCEPEWAPSVPPEGDVRASWPMATLIAILSGITAPMIEETFLGPQKPEWTVPERSARIGVGAATGILGSLFPYVLSPRPWSAKKEIEKIRIEGLHDGAMLRWQTSF